MRVHTQSLSHVRLFATPWTVACRLLCPWNFAGKITGVGCHFLLQGIFLTQGLNPCLLCLLHWQVDFFTTAPLGSPVRGEPSVIKKVYCILLVTSSSVLEIDNLVYLSNRLLYLRKACIFSFSRALLPSRGYSQLQSDCF